MREPFIFLCPEVTREDAYKLIEWMKDEEVIKYLSDTQDVSHSIKQVVERVNMPVLTHIFNSNGRFYIAYNKQNTPVGFVRLIKNMNETEIVIVIGDRNNWGKKLGFSTIKESMKIAFFELRSSKLIAKIHKDNKRSVKAFLNAGFKLSYDNGNLLCFSLTMSEYINSITNAVSKTKEIYITEIDKSRLIHLIEELMNNNTNDSQAKELEHEINSANVINYKRISQDVVTMNSKVLLQIDGDEKTYTLVYPEEADSSGKMLSVLSPIGTAILGYSEGDNIAWKVQEIEVDIKIKKILYQPEAAGDYHL